MAQSMYDVSNNAMSLEQTKDFVYNQALEMLEISKDLMVRSINKIINSGLVDWDSFDINKKMIIPKTILLAVLEEEAQGYKGKGTSLERKVRKTANKYKEIL
jgi:DNA replication protein DnaD